MADHLLQDRQDAQIWNAIEAGNFKQALKLVDKRLAKKHTDYLEALKIYIRSRSGVLTERSAVLLHLEDLPGRKPPITDSEVIGLYDEAWGETLPNKQGNWAKTIGELRWQCVKAFPKKEKEVLKCFQECLSNGDLDHARQISNSLEKAFPSSHAYIFWNISTMFLYSLSQVCPESQKRIWGGLAFGQITKLAVTTRQAPDLQKLPIRSVQTPQELLLLHRITQEHGKAEQRLEYLNDTQLGPDSVVAKGEWELWRFRLKLIQEAEQWEELFNISSKLLQRARSKDASGSIIEPGMSDWIIWEAFIRSAIELPGHKHTSTILKEIEAHLSPDSGIDKSWRRNASLAWVKICFDSATPFSITPATGEHNQTLNHVQIIIKYLRKYGDATTAYNDLRPFVERLDSEERKELLGLIIGSKTFKRKDELSQKGSLGPLGEDLSTAISITQAVNSYKLRYLLISGLPEYDRAQSPLFISGSSKPNCIVCSDPCGLTCNSCLTKFAEDAANAYKMAVNNDGTITKDLLTTDRHPADDLCVLAAMCLLKIALAEVSALSGPLDSPKTTCILQATALLECGWTRSKSNFQINLFLIRLYLYLGCGSLAMRAHQRLSIKNIQLDTLTYILFDRISSQHPHPFSHNLEGTENRTLKDHLKKQQKLYRGARNHTTQNIWTSFKQGNYNSIFEINEVSQTLSRTLSGAMSAIETRKITRLTEPSIPLNRISDGYDILPPNPEYAETKLIDTNDYDSFPNYESSQGPRFEKLSRFSPAPSEYRYRVDLVAEKLMQLVSPSLLQDGERVALQSWVRDHVDSRESANEKIDQMTLPEQLAARTYHDMATILRDVGDKERRAEEDYETKLEARNTNLLRTLEQVVSLISKMEDLVPAFSNTLHVLYIGYEIATTALHFSVYLKKHAKDMSDEQKEANELTTDVAQRLLKVIHEKCAIVKEGFDESGWIDKVLENTLPESGQSGSIGDVLKDLIDENFLEEWAGLVVESWKDSAAGLALLKPVKA